LCVTLGQRGTNFRRSSSFKLCLVRNVAEGTCFSLAYLNRGSRPSNSREPSPDFPYTHLQVLSAIYRVFFFRLIPPVLSGSVLLFVKDGLDVGAMSVFSYIRSIYQLDTLDTRFTNSSTTPYKRPVNAQTDPTYSKSSQDLPQGEPVKLDSNGRPIAQPSKWNTPEFYFYYFVFLTIVPYMFWVAYDVSRRLYPNLGLDSSVLTLI
jgi:hypothetical protein